MSGEIVTTLAVNSGALGLVWWGIKRTIDGAIRRWTDRIEKIERDLALETAKREALDKIMTDRMNAAGAAMAQKLEEAHEEVDDLRENKMDREESMKEMGRIRQTLERLVEGQAEMKGRMQTETNLATAIVSMMQKNGGAANGVN